MSHGVQGRGVSRTWCFLDVPTISPAVRLRRTVLLMDPVWQNVQLRLQPTNQGERAQGRGHE